jgi:hypothetical protein
MRRPADRNILAQRRQGAEERISETFGKLPRYTGVLLEICEHVGLTLRVSRFAYLQGLQKPSLENRASTYPRAETQGRLE